jgi:hypothetical protein
VISDSAFGTGCTPRFTRGIMGNLMSEFWPNLKEKFLHRR